MAKNTGTLKRDPVKYIRDGIKAQYNRKAYCEICDTNEDIELHHYHTVSYLLEKYAKEKGLDLSTKENVLAMRDDFYKIYWHELVDDTVSLCSHHHITLHKIYGQKPSLHSTDKQRVWVKKQYDKAHGITPPEDEMKHLSSSLESFCTSGTDSLLRFLV